MGQTGREFDPWAPAHLPETPPKRAPGASQWEAPGDNAPDANTSCRPLARCANGRQRAVCRQGTQPRHACTQRKVCMAAGAGARLCGFIEGIEAVLSNRSDADSSTN